MNMAGRQLCKLHLSTCLQLKTNQKLTMGAGIMPPMNMAGEAPGGPPAMPGAAIMPGGGIIMGPKPVAERTWRAAEGGIRSG